jgi:YYY domain-containing protein
LVSDRFDEANVEGDRKHIGWQAWAPVAILFVIVILGAVLRLQGIAWDEFTHLHPDERFLTMVETGIELPGSIGEYFNTQESAFNPYNKGFGFFVYGTFPIFLVRYVADLVGRTGYDEIYLVGRGISALFDLVSILLLYAIGKRLYDQRVGLLAAFFMATSVLLIQHAHFFVVDSVANTFVLAGFYFAVRALEERRVQDYAFFGISLGLAVASKINTAPMAGLIVLAGLVYIGKADPSRREKEFVRTLGLWILAAVASLITFRIFQPYAFTGPSILNILPNPQWLSNMSEIRQLNQGNTDAPYALQWANRTPVVFSLKNMILWGMGIPLGIFAWISWGWALIQTLRGRWERHLLPVAWTGVYFLWQSTGFTPAMRYQMPVYPSLVLLAAWGIWELWDRSKAREGRQRGLLQAGTAIVAGVVILGTLFWAVAFTSIYREPFTRAEASRWIYRNVPGILNLTIETEEGELLEALPMPAGFTLAPTSSHTVEIHTDLEGELTGLLMPYVSTGEGGSSPASFTVQLLGEPSDVEAKARATFNGNLSDEEQRLELSLDRSLPISPASRLFLKIENTGPGPIAMRGSTIVQETTWDDGLPWGVDGRSLGGRYDTVNLELYWHDDQDDDMDGVPDKLERIAEQLEAGDYLTISSNRQYGTTTRVPVRYPLTIAYYQALLGCPDKDDIIGCYAAAEVGDYEGRLGYSLVEVFESHPAIGSIKINDQLSEETFTVYDHPKALIFKKDADFTPEMVYGALAGIDVSNVVHVLPKDAGAPPKDLALPQDRWDAIRSSGTWSELFDVNSFVNRYPLVTIVIWWGAITLIGLVAFPITKASLFGLPDGGYALSRLAGLVVLAWGSWMLGSAGVAVTPGTIFLVLLALAATSTLLAWRYRDDLKRFVGEHKREILVVEAIALGFFVFDLLIRFGNPDLWHPGYGGEKPMDFSYLNAVLKSETFPPYDPWFAGGYINYYYYGFVLMGMPVKLLGIVPSVAYNLILPTLFSLLALAAYSVGCNLVHLPRKFWGRIRSPNPRLAGILAALILVVFGNLGTAKMFYEGFKRIGASPETPEIFIPGALQAIEGAGKYVLGGERMPYPLHQWYWNPSRSITPGEGEAGPITEFPFFTFLYGDLHAHMINRPLTLMALAWALSWVLSAERGQKRRWPEIILAMYLGGLIYGALRPTNTWDFPVYWALGVIALAYAAWLRHRESGSRQLLEAGLAAAGLVLLAHFLYQPYHAWYGQGYQAVEIWKGSLTPIMDYVVVYGLFLFVIISWMATETIEWMAETPISALSRFKPYLGWIVGGTLAVITVTGFMIGLGYAVVLFVIPLGLWAVLLLFRSDQPAGKQVAIFLVGAGLALTLLVEIVVLRGDISRMNTVFKFYLQVWELFSVVAAAAIAWIASGLPGWNPIARRSWTFVLGILLFSAAMFPIMAGAAKVRDRMTITAPHTLDGMAFMAYAENYFDLGKRIDLPSDFDAIRWMQENVEGTPVIVEANVPEYRWGTRYTIYTGLPSVLGWRWHQSQQRVAAPNQSVDERLFDITDFYLTRSIDGALAFLDTYEVEYIIVGSLEKTYYEEVGPCWPAGDGLGVTCNLSGWPMGMPTSYEISIDDCKPDDPENPGGGYTCPTFGLEKFGQMAERGMLEEVYQSGVVTIYRVVR